MTHDEFMKRCETLWNLEENFNFTTRNKGILWQDRNVSRALANAADCYLRLRDVYKRSPELFKGIWHEPMGQGKMAMESLTDYQIYPSGEGKFKLKHTLAGDDYGYAAVRIAAVIDHPCQLCAEDVDAWHTRYGFCEHGDNNLTTQIAETKKRKKK